MSDFDTTMEALKQRFIARSMDDLISLRLHQRGQPLPPGSVRSIVHRMAGSAGMFGFVGLGVLAGTVDAQLAQTGDESALPQLLDLLEKSLPDRG